MQVRKVLHAVRWNTGWKFAIWAPSHNFVDTCLSCKDTAQQSGKKLVKQQYLIRMSSQYDKLWPINSWDRFRSFGHRSRFRVLPLLLQRCRSPEANQTLHDVWPSPGLVHYIYIFGGFWPLRELCQVQTSLYVQVLRCPILVALLHGTRVVGVSQTSRHWADGWPSRALAHILVALWIANYGHPM